MKIGMFDIIFCSHTLEHVKDCKLALDNMIFSLNKGGVCLIIIPLESEEEVHSAAHHSFFKNGEQIKKHLLSKKIIKIIYEDERKRENTKREFWCLFTK
jgi:ubiquinone/menaquinone biosynthesis C-methylase UbiE